MFELIPFDRRGSRVSAYDPFRMLDEMSAAFSETAIMLPSRPSAQMLRIRAMRSFWTRSCRDLRRKTSRSMSKMTA